MTKADIKEFIEEVEYAMEREDYETVARLIRMLSKRVNL